MLEIETTKLGNVAVLKMQGRIVIGETDALRMAVAEQMDACTVILDLSHVQTIDAGGLGVMLELKASAESKGIEFRLRNVTRLVNRVLEITSLDSVFKISGDSLLTGAQRSRAIPVQRACCA